MTVRVEVQPELLAWASQRSRRDIEDLNRRFSWLDDGERGQGPPPTLRQLEDFATETHTPIGMLLLQEPPVERLPLPDFRTLRDERLEHPSVDLLDTIHLAQQRQEWYRSYARFHGLEPVAVVGSLDLSTDVGQAGARIRDQLHFAVDTRSGSWTDALRGLTEQAENLGIMVMVSGVVGSNNRRVLDPEEFRGFSLVDEFAPVVFVNGADTKAAQNFTLVHELVHVWLGEGGVDNPSMGQREQYDVERWCNAVAAEVLVPGDDLLAVFDPARPPSGQLDGLARRFKVSTLVVLHSLFDARALNWHEFRAAYAEQLEKVRNRATGSDGGNYYNTTPARASKRFTRAILTDVFEGRTSQRDASRLIGVRKSATLERLAEHVGVA